MVEGTVSCRTCFSTTSKDQRVSKRCLVEDKVSSYTSNSCSYHRSTDYVNHKDSSLTRSDASHDKRSSCSWDWEQTESGDDKRSTSCSLVLSNWVHLWRQVERWTTVLKCVCSNICKTLDCCSTVLIWLTVTSTFLLVSYSCNNSYRIRKVVRHAIVNEGNSIYVACRKLFSP